MLSVSPGNKESRIALRCIRATLSVVFFIGAAAVRLGQKPQHATSASDQRGWREVIWRAWHSCTDTACAEHLHGVVADEVRTLIERRYRSPLVLLGLLAGALAGGLISVSLTGRTISGVVVGPAGWPWGGIVSVAMGWGGLAGLVVGWSLTSRLSYQGRFVWPGYSPQPDPWVPPEIYAWQQAMAGGYIQGALVTLGWLIGANFGIALMLLVLAGHGLHFYLAQEPDKKRQQWYGLGYGLLAVGSLTLAVIGFSGELCGAFICQLLLSMLMVIFFFPWRCHEKTISRMIGIETPLWNVSTQLIFVRGFWGTLLVLWPLPAKLLVDLLLSVLGHLGFWQRQRPLPDALEAALQQACATLPAAQALWGDILPRLMAPCQTEETPTTLVDALYNADWIVRLRARHALLRLGGQAVPALEKRLKQRYPPDKEQRQIVRELLYDIVMDTTNRLRPRTAALLCPHCLARCRPRRIHLRRWFWRTWYGCRVCSQSREWLEPVRAVVAVLDASMQEAHVHRGDTLLVNWLQGRTVFDWDRVDIIQATDADIERFIMQIGNHTDPILRARYPTMTCLVAPDCSISEPIRRLLQHQFGQVCLARPALDLQG